LPAFRASRESMQCMSRFSLAGSNRFRFARFTRPRAPRVVRPSRLLNTRSKREVRAEIARGKASGENALNKTIRFARTLGKPRKHAMHEQVFLGRIESFSIRSYTYRNHANYLPWNGLCSMGAHPSAAVCLPWNGFAICQPWNGLCSMGAHPSAAVCLPWNGFAVCQPWNGLCSMGAHPSAAGYASPSEICERESERG